MCPGKIRHQRRDSTRCQSVNSFDTIDSPAPSHFNALTTAPKHPTLRANLFPKVTDRICRLPLSTFFYRLESMKLGNLMRFIVRPNAKLIFPFEKYSPMDFQGLSKEIQRSKKINFPTARTFHKEQNAFPTMWPPLRIIRFRGRVWLLTRKENSCQIFRQRLHVRLRCRFCRPLPLRERTSNPIIRCSNLKLLPFRIGGSILYNRANFYKELPNFLGSTNSCPITVHMKPFSTSAYKDLTCIFATSTKICTGDRSNHAYALIFYAIYNMISTPSYS